MTTPPPLNSNQSGLATASLALGIASLVLTVICIGPLFAIPAVICGHIALVKIKRSNGMLTGSGTAIAGLVTGYISLALIPFFAAIAIPNFVHARDTAQKNACINNLRVIDNAKQQWALENGKSGEDVPTAQDLDKFIPGGFAHLNCPRGGEYVIGKVSEPPACSIPNHVLAYKSYTPASQQPFNQRRSQFAASNDLVSIMKAQKSQALIENQCHLNVRMINVAKLEWASRHQKQPTDVPTEDDLAPFFPDKKLPTCPAGGTYKIGSLAESPTCSIPEHN